MLPPSAETRAPFSGQNYATVQAKSSHRTTAASGASSASEDAPRRLGSETAITPGRDDINERAVEGQSPRPWVQLLIYGFAPGAAFQGQLVGALERMETGLGLRILDVLFVGKDASTGEIAATSVQGHGTGGIAPALLGFRLDAAERRRATEQTLSSGEAVAKTVQQLADALEPGAAIAAVLVEHHWGRALDDAVSRMGGAPLADGYVEAASLAELESDLLSAARGLRGEFS
jgi:hypothetical protein